MKRANLKIIHGKGGLSLVEIIVATAILSFLLISTGLMFTITRAGIFATGGDRSALTVAVRKMEELKSLSYEHEDLAGSAPPGIIHLNPANPITVDDRGTELNESDDIKAYLRWVVTDLDNSANGTGSTDYKLVRVEVSRDSEFQEKTLMIVLESLITP
ncbi:MAG: hypothetical protein QXH17_09595 [Candidatus Bathyarchaeia archaeon]